MRRGLATIGALLAGALCAAPASAVAAHGSAPAAPATTSVIGGRAASIAEFPWLAYIAIKSADGPVACTGALVAPRVVLTAGHCVRTPERQNTYPPSLFRVLTGVSNLRKVTAANVSRISRVISYPSFETARQQVDAGLLVLSRPVAAPSLRLAGAADSGLLRAGTPISIAGWGQTTAENEVGPAILQSARLVLQSPGYCRQATRRFESFYSTAAQLCALDAPKRAASGCFGDSGGPAVATAADGTPVEVGIVVSGAPKCSPKQPNIYTRLAKISGWVAGWIATVERGAPPPPTPEASPPYLTFERAQELGGVALVKVFRDRFRNATEVRAACERLDWARVRCRVAWRSDERRYHGSFTVSFVVDGYEVTSETETRISID